MDRTLYIVIFLSPLLTVPQAAVKNRRLERINNLIRIELGELILRQLRDPRLAQVVSVTAVDVSPDLISRVTDAVICR